jgi:amino acid adenylation domain-containing protein
MSQFQKDQVQDIYYLSPMQEGMLFHTLLHQEQHFYIEQLSMQVEGSFRTDLLEQSLHVLVDRYEILRTVFVHEIMKRPVQVVLKTRNVQVPEVDLSALADELQEQRIREYKQQDKEQGFDLSKDIPLRTCVFKKAEGVYEWVWSYHHILLDGWCFGIVMDELFQVYESLLHDSTIDLPPVKPYKEYIDWLERQDKDQSLHYWGHYLSGFEGQTTFGEQRKKNSGNKYESAEMRFQLTEDQTRVFSEMASALAVTQSTALQAVWAVLVSRYQRVNDVVFGTVVSGRPPSIDGVENMVGLFINVVPTRVQVSTDTSFAQLLAELQRQSLQSEPHQYVPIYEIQSQAEQQELIDHIVVFENYPLQEADQGQQQMRLGFSIGKTDVFEKSNYDLNLVASPGSELRLKVAYNSNVYDHSLILRLKGQLLEILRQISQNPHIPFGGIRVVSEEEQQRLLAEFNGTLGEPDPLTLPQRFDRHAELTPYRTAITSADRILTYAELNAQANRFAHTLVHHGVVRGTVVALLVHRSSEMVTAIMAVLKAGGAYVPIDPEYPEERIRYMLEDSGAALLLTQRDLAGCAAAVGYEDTTLFVDDPLLYRGDAANLEIDGDPSDLAYIMYTSGTTGTPKGTLTTHANITRVVRDTNYIEITGHDTLLSLANYAFDGFTFDLFGALLNGAKLVLAPQETILHIGKLAQLIEDEHVTVMFVTTALFNVLVDAGSGWMKGMRKVLFGGERSSVHHVRKALQLMGKDRLIHVYGPTETTVFATFHPVNEVAEEAVTVPIGTPLHLTGAFILGPTDQLQPIEAVGELCLSGTGLVRGYLNRPELTAEKFVRNPYIPGQKIYRTGDLARWLPDGSIELTGRIDDQVKIRGHRIELAEIEAQLLRHAGVKEAVVLAVRSETGMASLRAYVVGETAAELSSQELAGHLRKTMPAYMIPQSFVMLDRLPLNANGKVNRRLLPEPRTTMQPATEWAPPTNEVERKLTAIWSELLGVHQIGIHDNFFDLGGHSLKAMALCAIMLKQFDKDVPVRLVFESPTVAGIAGYLQNTEDDTDGNPAIAREPDKTIFNPDGSRNLFLFPPVLGLGIMFHELAQQLPDYRFHAFDFMAEEDRIGKYVKAMQNSQPEGPLYLLGYSAGCGLAFEVAQALEQSGRIVQKLVMVDSYFKTGIADLEGRSVKQDVEALMEANQDNPFLEIESVRQGFQGKVSAYYTYYVNLIHSGQVQAPIHLIQSETAVALPSWMASWSGATLAYYEKHQGYGKHDDMLQGDSALRNAKLIRRIFQEPGHERYASSELSAPLVFIG